MSACHELEPLLLDRAAGDLDPRSEEAAQLDAHLAGCAACRAEVAACAEALSLARLPPPAAAERKALAGLADALRADQGAAAGRRSWSKRIVAGVAVAAAAAAFLVAPAFSRRAPTLTPAEVAAARAAAGSTTGWIAPDPDELWEVARALLSDDADDEAASEESVADQPVAVASNDAAASASPLLRDKTTAIAAADAWFDSDTTAR